MTTLDPAVLVLLIKSRDEVTGDFHCRENNLAERQVWCLSYWPAVRKKRLLAKSLLTQQSESGASQAILAVQQQPDAVVGHFRDDFKRLTQLDTDQVAFVDALEGEQ